MTTSTFWHSPRCSKSRAALALLQARGIALEIVDYVQYPPSAAQLRMTLQKLNLVPRDLLRTGEEAYQELGLDNPALDEEALIAAMATHPQLIERPIFVHGDCAVVGRPPERVLDVL